MRIKKFNTKISINSNFIQIINFNTQCSLKILRVILNYLLIFEIIIIIICFWILNKVKNVLILQCVFFFLCVSVYSITSRNNAPISNFGGGFRCKNEYPWCIIEVKS
ncbi:Uncharacterized protein FWK35_00003309, partial [Aphis craccivora]